jgi:hypothetical protein
MKSQVRLTENHPNELGGWRGIFLLAALACLIAGRAAAGTISVVSNTITGSTQTFNLSAEGDLDWAKWGILTTTDYDHKNTGAAPQIPNYSIVGGTALNYYTGSFPFSWVDGSVDATLVNAAGTYTSLTNVGTGYTFSVPASPTPKVLNLYVGQYKAVGGLTLQLSDGSVPPILITNLNTGNQGANWRYSITFSGDPGTSLSVSYTIVFVTAGYGNGNISLPAASLSSASYLPLSVGAPTLNCPSTVASNSTFILSSTVTGVTNNGATAFAYQWQVSSNGGGYVNITNAVSNPLPATAGSPGSYNYRLVVTNSVLGTAVTSAPVALTVTAPTGVLSGSASFIISGATVNLSAVGTTDWAEWGESGPSIDDYTGLIQNYTQIGSDPIGQFTSTAKFSWTNASTADNPVTGTTSCVGIPKTDQPDGFEVLIPASTAQQTALIYIGTLNAQIQIQASLSDGSGPFYTATNATTTGTLVYSIRYSAASAGQTLQVKITAISHTGANPAYSLEAVALQPYVPPTGTLSLLLREALSAPVAIHNLSQEGDLDWSRWGGSALNNPTYPGLDQKEIGGTAVNLIGNYTAITNLSNNPLLLQTYTGAVGCTWTDGIPTLKYTNNINGIVARNYGNGFEVDAAAAQTNRIFDIDVGCYKNNAVVSIALSDNSAPAIVDYSMVTTNGSAIYHIVFSASSPGQHLIFQIYQTFSGPGGGNVSIGFATLSSPNNAAPLAVTTPVLVPTNVMVAGSTVTLTALPSGIPPFSYFWMVSSNGSAYGPIAANTNSAELITVVGAPASYNYVLVVTNGQGSITSAPVALTVSGPATSEIIGTSIDVTGAAVNLDAEGTVDWEEWSTNSTTTNPYGIVRKLTGGSEITNFIPVGGGFGLYQLYNATASYNWTNGTPDLTGNSAFQCGCSGLGTGFELHVQATNTENVFNIYCGGIGLSHFEATMSDNSAPIFVQEFNLSTATPTRRYSIRHSSPTPGTFLIVRYYSNGGNVELAAATLATGLTVGPLVLAPTNVVTPGTPVTVTGAATGTAPLSYQWLVSSNGSTYAAITNATANVLAVTNLTAAVYDYELVITNSQGAVTSLPVALTVSSGQPVPPGTIHGPIAGPVAGQYTLSWTNASALLLQAPNVTGPWTTNSAVSPYTFTPTNSQMFFRLQGQ